MMPNPRTGSAVKILVLGATGLLGNAVFRGLSKGRTCASREPSDRKLPARLFAPE